MTEKPDSFKKLLENMLGIVVNNENEDDKVNYSIPNFLYVSFSDLFLRNEICKTKEERLKNENRHLIWKLGFLPNVSVRNSIVDERNFTDGHDIFLQKKYAYFNSDKTTTPRSENFNFTYSLGALLHEGAHILEGSFLLNIKEWLEPFKYKFIAKDFLNTIEDGRIEYAFPKWLEKKAKESKGMAKLYQEARGAFEVINITSIMARARKGEEAVANLKDKLSEEKYKKAAAAIDFRNIFLTQVKNGMEFSDLIKEYQEYPDYTALLKTNYQEMKQMEDELYQMSACEELQKEGMNSVKDLMDYVLDIYENRFKKKTALEAFDEDVGKEIYRVYMLQFIDVIEEVNKLLEDKNKNSGKMPTGVDDPHLTENPNGISVPQDGFSEEDKKKIRKIIEKHAKDKSGGNYTPDLEKRLKEAKEGKEEKKEEENKENKPTKPLASPKKSEKNESAGENKDKQSKSMCDRSGNFIDFDFKKPETEADKTYQDELFHEYWPHIHAIKEKIEEMQPNQWKVNIDNRGPMMHPLGLYLAGVDPNAKNLPRINLEKRELDYEINLLLDCSDSTSGEKGVLYYEKICAGMIAKAFDEDFPTTGERFGHSDKGLEVKLYGFNSSWSSGIQIYTAENLEELAKFTSDGGTPEAEALRILSQEKILPSTKRDKMLFVFADGQPNDVYAAKEELQTIKNKGVNVFYILVSESGEQGVDWSNYDILKQGATESRVLYDPSELPGIVRDIVTEYVGV